MDDVKRVEDFFNTNDCSHLREAAVVLGLSIGKVWRILRNDLKWKPYRPDFVPTLEHCQYGVKIGCLQLLADI